VLLLLERHELTVGELCTILQLPQSTVSRHLKLLADDGWLVSRGEGTSRFYRMLGDRLDGSTKSLWSVVRGQISAGAGARQDERRADGVLAKRRDKAIVFFRDSSKLWDVMRAEMIGERADLLALLHLLDDNWVVGDLGCGTGHVAEALAPCVAKVIAVDESGPMLESAPIDDGALDAAILFLVAHFVMDPARAMAEVRRVLRPGGRLLVVDLMSHDRVDYVVQLGHVWQGFDGPQMTAWLEGAGFTSCRYQPLPVAPEAKGPTLFVATGRKQ
jgi:DNA-binding transcriptional ArsR family regulator